MNAIILTNIELMLSDNIEEVMPPAARARKCHKSLEAPRMAFIKYILKHGQATGMELLKNCMHNNVQPSMALRPYVRNGSLEYIKTKWSRTSYYKLAKGITPKVFGVEE